jgi:hypothetical protein
LFATAAQSVWVVSDSRYHDPCRLPPRDKANYINALAVSVLRPFELAGLITLGDIYFTLGELVFTFHLTIFNVMFGSEYF